MNLTNYHSHTPYCDGRSNIEEFIATALIWGFTSYGVSPHSPLPLDSSCNMKSSRVKDYIDEMNFLKHKYEGKIELYTGMEIDYLGDDWNASIPYFRDMKLDYRIASLHFLSNKRGEYADIDCNHKRFKEIVDTHFDGDIRFVVEQYFIAMRRMIKAGGYDFVGHADKISMNASSYQPGITSTKWYKEIIDDYFNFIAKEGVMLEINTKAYDKNGYFFPNAENFKMLKDLSIPLVVNSDAHIPSFIKSGYDMVFSLLKESGFGFTMQLKNGKWVENPL